MLLVLSESVQAALWTRAIRPKARARLRVELLPLSTMGAHPVAPADRDDVSLNVRCSTSSRRPRASARVTRQRDAERGIEAVEPVLGHRPIRQEREVPDVREDDADTR